MNELELLVPAYGNPAKPDGSYMWNSLIEIGQNSNVKLNVILNPNSGPGDSPIDPNYINNAGSGPLLDLKNAGGVVYGYVATENGNRSIEDVKADIDMYNNSAYYQNTGFQIDGIFLDQMSNKLAEVPYYQQIYDYIKLNHPSSAKIIGNPGTSTIEEYVNTVDTLVIFEDYGVKYRENYNQPDWVDNYTAAHFAHLIHTESLESDMLADLQLAKSRNVSMIYITNDICDPNMGSECTQNPWNKLPSYWRKEVEALSNSYSTTDFTVILFTRQHFGNQPGIFEDIEPSVPFAGATKDYSFDCPNVNPNQTAVLMFQSRDVDHPRNVFQINGVSVYGGLPVSPNRNTWNSNTLLVEPRHLLRGSRNILNVESRNSSGGNGGNLDDFIIDNIIIFYKTK